jgi:hypothetical protein
MIEDQDPVLAALDREIAAIEARIAAEAEREDQITIHHYFVAPVYIDGVRVGTCVRDEAGNELEESDASFRAAAVGGNWRGDTPPPVDGNHGIVGGEVIFRRAVPHLDAARPNIELPPQRLDEAAVNRARSRIESLPDRR